MKTAIVSGAPGNLGQAICAKFLSNDYRVIGTATTHDKLSFYDNKNFELAVLDLTAEDKVQEFAASIIKKYDSIDVAVLTVGGFAMGKIADTDISAMQKQYKLNFETTYNLARPLFMHMIKQGRGHIFLTGARTGSEMRLSKGSIAYGLSKSLVFRLAELMNEEAKGTDVVTSIISPSTIDTPQNRAAMPDADFNKWVKAEAIADIIFNYCQQEAAVLRDPVLKVYNKA